VSFISFVTLGTNKVRSLVVSNHIESINSNWGVSFHSILVTITQLEIRFKTKVSHKHIVVIYHWNTPLPKVRKGLDRYNSTHRVYMSKTLSQETMVSNADVVSWSLSNIPLGTFVIILLNKQTCQACGHVQLVVPRLCSTHFAKHLREQPPTAFASCAVCRMYILLDLICLPYQ
jgi:hypothetical protein